MSSIVVSGDTSGAITLAAPAVAGTNTITLPAGTGTATVAGVNSNIVSGTSVASTSGTSITFTGIPSWAKRITMMLNGVSTSGTSNILFQIGSGSLTTSGYLNTQGVMAAGTMSASYASSAGVSIGQALAASLVSGNVVFTNVSGNIWSWSAVLGGSSQNFILLVAGNIALGGVLDRVAITTTNGTDTFDAGSINILYE